MSKLTMVAWDDGAEHHEAPLGEADLEELVSKLDGRTRTLVTLFVGDGHAACGGDARAGLATYVTLDGERFHQFVRGGEDGDGEVGGVAGGPVRSLPCAIGGVC